MNITLTPTLTREGEAQFSPLPLWERGGGEG
jgi:hypothetical protein